MKNFNLKVFINKSENFAQSKLSFVRTHVHVSVTFRNLDFSCNLNFIQTQMALLYDKKKTHTNRKLLEKEEKTSRFLGNLVHDVFSFLKKSSF